jgi:hypothetical protein
LPKLEIHDASDRIRTIGRRGAAGDDLDALDQCRRNDVHVWHAFAVCGNEPSSVEQHQSAAGSQAPEVERRLAVRDVIRGAGRSRDELRHEVQAGFDRRGAGLRQDFCRYRDDRARRNEIRACDARARDHDLLEGLVLRDRRARQADGDGGDRGAKPRRP